MADSKLTNTRVQTISFLDLPGEIRNKIYLHHFRQADELPLRMFQRTEKSVVWAPGICGSYSAKQIDSSTSTNKYTTKRGLIS